MVLPLGIVHAIRQQRRPRSDTTETADTSSAPPKPPLSPDWRSTVSRIAADDDGFPATKTALQGVFDAVAAAFATPDDLELQITSMAPDDDNGKEFVAGYVDVRQPRVRRRRGRTHFVRAGLEAGRRRPALSSRGQARETPSWVDTEGAPTARAATRQEPFLWVHGL